ncbi:Hypothetical protein UVM_LOCUS166, partial [uncultured virus]
VLDRTEAQAAAVQQARAQVDASRQRVKEELARAEIDLEELEKLAAARTRALEGELVLDLEALRRSQELADKAVERAELLRQRVCRRVELETTAERLRGELVELDVQIQRADVEIVRERLICETFYRGAATSVLRSLAAHQRRS